MFLRMRSSHIRKPTNAEIIDALREYLTPKIKSQPDRWGGEVVAGALYGEIEPCQRFVTLERFEEIYSRRRPLDLRDAEDELKRIKTIDFIQDWRVKSERDPLPPGTPVVIPWIDSRHYAAWCEVHRVLELVGD